MTEAEALDEAAKAAGWVDWKDACHLAERGEIEVIRAHGKTLVENAALKAEIERLRDDFRKALENEEVATCEGCNAPLLNCDDYVSNPDGISGCWHTMTDARSGKERPCYAYRVGKPDARAALKEVEGD